MSILVEQLERLSTARHLVDVWRDLEDSDPVTGLIASWSAEYLVLQEVNDDAEYDGVEILRLGGITRVRWGDQELGSIQRLMTSSATVVPGLQGLDLTSTKTIIESAYQVFGHVGLQLDGTDGYHIGDVLEIDDDHVHLRAYGTKRTLDRYEMVLTLDGVSRIEADGKYERRLISLFQ